VADEGTAGIGMFSTQADLIIGTATSSYSGTTYNLFPQNKYFNATQSATTTVPVTGTNGKLSQAFLDLTESWTFSGTTVISGALTSSGATIFSSSVDFSTAIPTIPTTAPTSDDEVASKKYVDDAISEIVSVVRTASSTSLQSDMGLASTTSTVYVKVKEAIMYVGGNVRFDFELRRSTGSGTVYGRIYVNAVAVGTERSSVSESFVNHTEQISLEPYDEIQLYIKADGGTPVEVQEVKLYYDATATKTLHN